MDERTFNDFDNYANFQSLEGPISIISENINKVDIHLLDKTYSPEYKYKLYAFVLISLLQIFVNYDNGVVPVMLNWIQEPYNFTESELGLMGSLPYVGTVLVSPFMSYIFLTFSIHKSLIVAMIMHIISLCIFGLAVNKYMFFISELLIGITRTLFFIYYPLWVDTFAPESHRNLWLSIIQSGIVFGGTFGYILTSLFSYAGKWSWRYSIFTQTSCELILTILFYSIPKEFINFDPSRDENINFDLCTCDKSKTTPNNDKHFSLPVINELQDNLSNNSKTNLLLNNSELPTGSVDLIVPKDSLSNSTPFDKNTIKRSYTLDCIVSKVSSLGLNSCEKISKIYSNFERSMLIPSEYSKCSKCFLNNVKLHQEMINTKNLSIWSKFKLLIREKVFILICLGISGLYFEITGIHYWMTKIGVTHLGVPEKVFHYIFTVEMVTGPVLGIISGSHLIDKIIYHYPNNPLLIDLTLIIWGSITCISSIILLLKQTAMVVATCIFVIIFFGSSLVPTITLMSVAYLPHRLKPAGASFFMSQYHIFGFTLGTFIPGVAVDIFNTYTAALIIIFLPGFIGLIIYFGIYYIKWKRIKIAKRTGRNIYIKGPVVI